jgi:AbiJ N-terminal domain 4
MGLTASVKELQITTIDKDLRNGLWNAYLQYVVNFFSASSHWNNDSQLNAYFRTLRKRHLKLPMDELSYDPDDNMTDIKRLFYSYEYGPLYDFLEFHASDDFLSELSYPVHSFIEECNRVMESEFSGYRFVQMMIVPISNQIEVDEINQALNSGSSFFGSSYANVNMHMRTALAKLSDKKNPDYRNSIKESISAVESLCRQLTGKSTLGEALKDLESKGIELNQQLKSGIEKLYAYTNQKDTGIRHALIEDGKTISFHEAKFMLVACSAFINFLIPQVKLAKTK